MKKIIVSCDSTCDLTTEIIDKMNIQIIPLYVHLNDKEYKDMIDITPDFIYEYYDKYKVLPKTAAPNIDDYLNHFSKWPSDEYDIIHISIGSGLSSSFQNSVIASNELDNVYVVDSKSLSIGSGFLAIKANEMINEGKTASEIHKSLEILKEKIEISFVIDDLTYLREGGRLNALAAFGANALKIKPTIIVNKNLNGGMEVGKKYRGNYSKVLLKYFSDKLKDANLNINNTLYIAHSGTSNENINLIKNFIFENFGISNIVFFRASCTISSHCGYNTIGIVLLND